MAADQCKDIEKGMVKGAGDELEVPFLQDYSKPIVDSEDEEESNGSVFMVVFSTCVAVCGSFEFGSCVGYSAPTQSSIRNDLDLSIAQFSTFGSIITIGAMIGAIASGRIADLVGRKGVPVFIAEIAPKNLRGGLTTINQLMIVCGSSVAFLLGTVMTWRQLALTGILPCVFLLVGLFFVPESPRWLAKVGREKDFDVALRKLRGKNADVSKEAAEIQAYVDTLQSLPKARILDLFDSKYIRAVIIGVGLMVFQQFIGINGIGFYASETFSAAGLSNGNIGTIAYAIVQVPITVGGAMLMDRSGRRPLLLVSATGTFIGCFLTGASFYLKGQSVWLNLVPVLAVSGVLIYIAAFSIGMGAVPWVIMSEIFPIHVKGAAGSLVVLVNWVGAWAVSYTFNFMMEWSSTATFMLYAMFCALTVLFVVKVVPETKGKTLEEIQAIINSST
nr:sugar transporter ERD6-like 16 [Ipomoea batatas]